MNITGKTAITGLIGYPIAHSKSYVLHNTALQALSIDSVYLPFLCPTEHMLHQLIPAFHAPSFLGANITTPHKQTIVPLLDIIDETATKIGAVNTICKTTDGALIGKNSDCAGFSNALQEANISTKERDVLLLGAGGAAKAVAHALIDSVSSLTISNRSTERAQSLIHHLKNNSQTPIYFSSDPTTLSIASNALIIQCTSLGNNGEIPPHPKIHKDMSVVDLLYTHTPFLQRASMAGAYIQNGMSMLIHQAALSFSWWHNTDPPIETMRDQLYPQRSFA